MLDFLLAPADLVSWRWLLQTLLLSLGLTLAGLLAFRGDSRSRRSLGVAAVWLLSLVPALLLVWEPRYQIGVVSPPVWPEFGGVPRMLFGIWLFGASVCCLQLTLRVARTRRALGALPLLRDSGVEEMLIDLCGRLKISPPRLVIGKRCCASSVGADTLMVPRDFVTWPVTAKRAVVAHELVHLQRRDDRFMVALKFLARCYLFCPWLHIFYTRFVSAVEEACDERAAELLESRTLYLEGLAEAALRDGGASYDRQSDFVGDTPSVRPAPVAGAATLINGAQKHTFMQRLARLLGEQQFFEVQSGALVAGLSTGLLALGLCTTFEFIESPRSTPQRLTNVRVVDLPVPLNAGSDAIKSSPALAGDRAYSPVTPNVEVLSKFPKSQPMREENYSPAVIYPGQALVKRIEGDVVVEFRIAADGTTVRPQVVSSTHPEFLNGAALRATQQTTYHSEYSKYQILPKSEMAFSGVRAVHDLTRAGGLLAANGYQSSKVQKRFLFRLNDAP